MTPRGTHRNADGQLIVHDEKLLKIRELEAKIELLQINLDGANDMLSAMRTCVVCSAALHDPTEPPHCQDSCHPNEEHISEWRSAMRTAEQMRTCTKAPPA